MTGRSLGDHGAGHTGGEGLVADAGGGLQVLGSGGCGGSRGHGDIWDLSVRFVSVAAIKMVP